MELRAQLIEKGAVMKTVLTGSVAFDYLMSFPGYFRDHILVEKLETISLSFLVDSMVRLRGGTAPNIAYTLALLGQHPCLFATVGEDFTDYRLWLESKGVDTTYARLIPVFTPPRSLPIPIVRMPRSPVFTRAPWHTPRSSR